MNRKKRYIIWTIGRLRNAGARVLYDLYDKLRARGYEALIYCPAEHLEEYEYIDLLDEETLRNDVVIYPEVVFGNPLRFQNVARFVLYFPGKISGETRYHPSEAIFTWSTDYCAGEWLAWNTIDLDLFKDENLPKIQNCYFYNKSVVNKELPELQNAVEINMHYPAKREELAKLLKTTRVLYSFEPVSVLNDEACLCGAKVKIITGNGFSDYKRGPIMPENDENILLNKFIKITQNMNYAGEIQEEEKFFHHFSGIFYKAAARCAALGAWEECLRYCRKAGLGTPLERPSMSLDIFKDAFLDDEKDARIEKEKAEVAAFLNLVRKKDYEKAEAKAINSIFNSLKTPERLYASIWASNLAMFYGKTGDIKNREVAQVIAFELYPCNKTAVSLLTLGLLDKKAHNLALYVICQSLALALQPFSLSNALAPLALLGYITANDERQTKTIAARMPELIANALGNLPRCRYEGFLGKRFPIKESEIYQKLEPEISRHIYPAAR